MDVVVEKPKITVTVTLTEQEVRDFINEGYHGYGVTDQEHAYAFYHRLMAVTGFKPGAWG